MSRRVLTEEQWERLEGHLPGRIGTPGRSGVDNRLFVDAILWMGGNAAHWRDLPGVFGKWTVRGKPRMIVSDNPVLGLSKGAPN